MVRNTSRNRKEINRFIWSGASACRRTDCCCVFSAQSVHSECDASCCIVYGENLQRTSFELHRKLVGVDNPVLHRWR